MGRVICLLLGLPHLLHVAAARPVSSCFGTAPENSQADKAVNKIPLQYRSSVNTPQDTINYISYTYAAMLFRLEVCHYIFGSNIKARVSLFL